MNLGVLLGICLLSALLAASIASSKGLSSGGFFVAGLLLPVVAVVVARPWQPRQPSTLDWLRPASGVGWWPDPTGRFDQRYFDGQRGTRDVFRDADHRQLENPV
jgi:hypothetical protein